MKLVKTYNFWLSSEKSIDTYFKPWFFGFYIPNALPKIGLKKTSLSDKPSFSYGPFRIQDRNPANDSSRKLRVGRLNFLLGKAYFHGLC